MEIRLYNGAIALIDAEDADLVMQRSWSCQRARQRAERFYARCSPLGGNTFLHRVIMAAKPGQIVDHINGNGLDNRKENLRFVTASQNVANSNWPRPESGYRGVYRKKNKWQAAISVANKTVKLGTFARPEEAAKAYDRAAAKTFGECATLNFPGEGA